MKKRDFVSVSHSVIWEKEKRAAGYVCKGVKKILYKFRIVCGRTGLSDLKSAQSICYEKSVTPDNQTHFFLGHDINLTVDTGNFLRLNFECFLTAYSFQSLFN